MALRINRYHVHVDDGNGGPGPLVAIADQPRGPLSADLVLHSGTDRRDVVATIRRRAGNRRFGALDVRDATGRLIGRTTEFRTVRGGEWLLEQCDGTSAEIRERAAASALGRRLWNAVPRWGDLPFPWRYSFDLVRGGVRLATVTRAARLRTRYLVEVHDPGLDRRLVLAQAVALEAGRHR